ncbi:MAG: hypothetical protein HYZ27_10280, partial [Deltaproteobacteria bacterium]|nr:hypothetical protein [Deltaproteobacteria bacterium]
MRVAGVIASLLALIVVSGACGEEEKRRRRPGGDYTAGCWPNCAGRVCGPDPVCGSSCGDCAGAGDGAGQCTLSSDGPAFSSFDTNLTVLNETQTLVFSATLTDPDGVSDVAGGTLVDPLLGGAYGAFVAAASAGSYTLSL